MTQQMYDTKGLSLADYDAVEMVVEFNTEDEATVFALYNDNVSAGPEFGVFNDHLWSVRFTFERDARGIYSQFTAILFTLYSALDEAVEITFISAGDVIPR